MGGSGSGAGERLLPMGVATVDGVADRGDNAQTNGEGHVVQAFGQKGDLKHPSSVAVDRAT